ncbi:FAD-dependent oxidoreductase [Haloferula sp.]|uniref:FAD-dependent oxidoreductase n=1 Tax=Haloferula sp. TaxID=2497595 RepID=UPI003C76018C
MIEKVVVLGSGSAGLLAALTLKRKLPQLEVEIVRDPDIGIIGVGEGSTPNLVSHLFNYVGIKRKRFYELAKPTWKLGIRFKWGPRGSFNYTFDQQLDQEFNELKAPNGFFCRESFSQASVSSCLMDEGKAFIRKPNGSPFIQGGHSFHIENEHLVECLESEAVASRVRITEGKMTGAERGDNGIEAIHLSDGRRIDADLFVDASGFRGELIGKVLEEPFVSFDKTLFCDRAVVGGWERGDEPILPYTTAEQMDSGWCWQIEHEQHINRGYVFSSDMISDEQAFEEFRRKNPKVPDTPRFVPFTAGHRRRPWVDNVFSVGNAAGFVEPLEATALMVICSQCKALATMIQQSTLELSSTMRDMYNGLQQKEWSLIRDFLGLHYKFNTAVDTPFWKRCREETDLSGIQDVLDFYEENGPSVLIRHLLPDFVNDFGVEGFLVMLVGNKAPCRKQYEPDSKQTRKWQQRCAFLAKQAKSGVDVKQALGFVRDPRWDWAEGK